MSVAVLLDNFVAASARLENEIKEARFKVQRVHRKWLQRQKAGKVLVSAGQRK